MPTEVVLADAGYGDQPRFLEGLEGLENRGLPYLVGVASSTHFRLAREVEEDPGEVPAPPYQGQGRPRRPDDIGVEDRIPRSRSRHSPGRAAPRCLAGHYLAGREQGQSDQGVHSSAGLRGWP